MFDELTTYDYQGNFHFKKGDDLSVKSLDVPKLPGVYYVIRLARGRVSLVYMGRSGAMLRNGRFRKPLLKEAINGKMGRLSSQEFFDKKMEEEHIDMLDIYWFATFDGQHQDLPGYVEALIMQRYYDVHKRLPPWNRRY